MASIIEQIQRDALDRSIRVSDLLRRVKLAAAKLKLGILEDWVEQELNGYKSAQLPDYRIINGRPVYKDPYGGDWQLLGGHVEGLSTRYVAQTIASLEELAIAPKGATIHFPFSDAVLRKLNETNNTVGYVAALEVDRSAIVSILDRVRTLVLNWALKMEQAGVLGSEFSFDAADREKAQASAMMINIGTIGSFAGNLGADNIAGDVSVRDLDLKLVHTLAEQLSQHASELVKAGADEKLKSRLEALEAELRKPQPTTSILRGLLVDLRNAIVGAAGNLMASGAIALINQILGTGVPTP
jgi:hypothetical protein